VEKRAAWGYLDAMDHAAPPPISQDHLRTALDRAVAEAAAARVVTAEQVHDRLRKAVVTALPQPHGANSAP
jgi:hypothetical protein